ncbi:hypothetical protein BTA51_00990 [Hahella sp. CCB-MM4]|uniref:carbon-nitrogen hydrolase family protein n=1 Tax=Hahella sp. (strain CCB-MM4) TaxID=1926491 RepID=UPI000B9BDD58|nr:carbon-nitrogen hydrolase family protein [Hahella sp. CCB-MM4]OZG75008.1 hypothetical protein BTA51_00990 [Hahella sp. CCB-MM4]
MDIKLAVAQISSLKGDIQANTELHLHAISQAAGQGVSYLVFPELSLTGYEPELAGELAFKLDDQRLQLFVEAASKHQMTIVVGAPIFGEPLPAIGCFIISPSGEIKSYRKMHLHPGEDEYFASGREHHLVKIGNTTIANAICADTGNVSHAEFCAELGADVYVAGVLITAGGYSVDTALLRDYSKKHHMLVAMANYSRPTGKWLPIGKSAVWWEGELLAVAGETENALVIAERHDKNWSASVMSI